MSQLSSHGNDEGWTELRGLPAYPRWIKLVDGLPKTATGKIQRFKLREAQ